MLTDEEIVDHVQHMGYEEMDVELIESDCKEWKLSAE